MKEVEVEAQMREIFSAVFNLPPESFSNGFSPDTCSRWDSLQHVHLVNAIDQEFGTQLTIEQQMEIMSFDLAIEVVHEALDRVSRP